jgi:uncharacterized protein (DUF427 family)
MSLTLGTGPFGRHPAGVFNSSIDGPKHVLYFEPFPRRIRALIGGETVIDTTSGMLLYESTHKPVLYVPEGDIRADLIEPTDHSTHCPYKGDASYWSAAGVENALWGYKEPIESAAFLLGYVAPYWNLFDTWFEEEEELTRGLRDPYHRIDVRETDARVTVRANGDLLAESDRARLLFETGIPPRAYLPLEDVREDLLARTETETACPYKGEASYWSVGDLADVAWSYRNPIPEAGAIEGLVSFLGDGVEVDIRRN